jgi:hypothetical protein
LAGHDGFAATPACAHHAERGGADRGLGLALVAAMNDDVLASSSPRIAELRSAFQRARQQLTAAGCDELLALFAGQRFRANLTESDRSVVARYTAAAAFI